MSKNKGGPPKGQTGFSSNWKKLQVSLKAESKKRRATAPESEQKRRKVGSKADCRNEGTRPVNGLHRGKKADRAEEEGAREKQTNPAPEKNEIWFDDVDEMLLERPVRSHPDQDPLVFQNAVTHPTKALAMDCEMVGVGKDGAESVLARVSIVNQHGHCLYDKFVKPREKVTDFRTHVSGVRPQNLRTAEEFLVVQKEVSDLLKGKLLVGHAIHNDLKVLFLDHPRRQIRDTSLYKPFKQLFGGRKPGLKKLSAKVLGVSVQEGEHSSVQDAQAAMRLYMTFRKKWESELSSSRHKGKKASGPGKKEAEGRKETLAEVTG